MSIAFIQLIVIYSVINCFNMAIVNDVTYPKIILLFDLMVKFASISEYLLQKQICDLKMHAVFTIREQCLILVRYH